MCAWGVSHQNSVPIWPTSCTGDAQRQFSVLVGLFPPLLFASSKPNSVLALVLQGAAAADWPCECGLRSYHNSYRVQSCDSKKFWSRRVSKGTKRPHLGVHVRACWHREVSCGGDCEGGRFCRNWHQRSESGEGFRSSAGESDGSRRVGHHVWLCQGCPARLGRAGPLSHHSWDVQF